MRRMMCLNKNRQLENWALTEHASGLMDSRGLSGRSYWNVVQVDPNVAG